MPEELRKPVSPELLAKIMDPQDLKNRRKQVGLTAGELAQLSGVPLSVILNIEGGRTPLRRETAEWLHAAIAHEEVTLAHPRKPFTPEQLAKISKHQRCMVTTTWFGTLISRVGIPRRFFPRSWVWTVKPIELGNLGVKA